MVYTAKWEGNFCIHGFYFYLCQVRCSVSRFILREESSWPGKKLIDGKLYESEIKNVVEGLV